MTDPDIEAACEDITNGLKTHRGCSPVTESPMTPTGFVDSILSACDPSNWDSALNKGAYYRGLHDAYTAIHEIAGDYQTAMYEWTRARGVAQSSLDRDAVARILCCGPRECRLIGDSEDGNSCYCDTSDFRGSGLEKNVAAIMALAVPPSPVAGETSKFSPGDPVEVRKIGEEIDEIVIRRGDVHIEQMDDSGWFMGIDASDGSYWQFWFGAKNRKSHVHFRHTETVPAPSLSSTSRATPMFSGERDPLKSIEDWVSEVPSTPRGGEA